MGMREYDELSDIFLDYRVTRLGECFSEWKFLVDSMIMLQEDPTPDYIACLENTKKMNANKRDKSRKFKQMKGEFANDYDDADELMKGEFVNDYNDDEELMKGEFVNDYDDDEELMKSLLMITMMMKN
ncbi:hypothetical protein Syun_022444 [Stephania yunnanensis]|uniref:Uncharacterized protein n=1 Tax=Stephania yunnanensis TaxID=152371 RepID=A0AAP0FIR8_9MAGN